MSTEELLQSLILKGGQKDIQGIVLYSVLEDNNIIK